MGRSSELVSARRRIVSEDAVVAEVVGKTPVRIQEVGEVVDVEANLNGVGLAANLEVDVLSELEAETALPWSNHAAPLGVFTPVLAEILVVLDECVEGIPVLRAREGHLREFRLGRDVDRNVRTAVAGNIVHHVRMPCV